MNHLMFILFPGTWPNYDVNQLGMNTGNAILARASASKVLMRTGFDISFPLVTSNYPIAGEPSRYPMPEDGRVRLNLLASFKVLQIISHDKSTDFCTVARLFSCEVQGVI